MKEILDIFNGEFASEFKKTHGISVEDYVASLKNTKEIFNQHEIKLKHVDLLVELFK